MIVCCPECGTSIWCADSQPMPTVIRDACIHCKGYGYITEHHIDEYTTVGMSSGHQIAYTCSHCNGSGRGDIKGFIE